MIQGLVNANLEAVLTLSVQGPSGQTQQVDAVIDTGFNGYLALPPTMVTGLKLPVVGQAEAVLADGSEAVFNVYGVTVVWDGQPRSVESGAVGIEPLVGTAMLDRHDLNIEFENGGRVVIQARA